MGLNIRDGLMGFEQFAKVFWPKGVEGRKMYGEVYYDKGEMEEGTLRKIGHVFKMVLDGMN